MNSRPVICALCLLLGSLPGSAPGAPAGTLDRLVEEFEANLGIALAGKTAADLDLGIALRTLGAVPPRLGRVVEELLLPRLKARGLRSVVQVPGALEEDARRRWAGDHGLELLLELDVMMRTGHLHIVGGLRACDRDLWRDTLHPRPGLLNHLHASARVDAEVRAYQGALASHKLRLSLAEYPLAGGGALALGAGDLDGDGRSELLVLQAREVRVMRYLGRDKGLKLIKRAALEGSTAAVRPRRAMGTLLATDLDGDQKAEVLLRSSEMAQGAELRLVDKNLIQRRALDGFPLAAGPDGDLLFAPALTGRDLLDGRAAVLLKAEQSAPAPAGLPPTFYSYRQATVPQQKGTPLLFCGVVDSAGRFQLLDPEGAKVLAPAPRSTWRTSRMTAPWR